MPQVVFTLISDGSSDRALLPILRWLILQHLPNHAVQDKWADFRRLRRPPKGLAERIKEGLHLYPCDLLFVHRDAENQDPAMRRREIADAMVRLRNDIEAPPPAVCVIPVRMMEAWLLFDERAIRIAAENPSGMTTLGLPSLQRVESLPDPKSVLHEALRQANGSSGRRMKTFERRLGRAVHLIAERMEDFSPLRLLPAFQSLEEDLKQRLAERRG